LQGLWRFLRNDGIDGAGMRNVENKKALKGKPINALHLKSSSFAPPLKKLKYTRWGAGLTHKS